MTPPRLPRTAAILGGGAVGCVLLPALRTIGVRIVAAWSRSPKTPQWRGGMFPRALREAELVLLSVSDDAIAPLCAQLVAERLISSGQLVAHLAGALDLSPLEPALAAGAKIGSLHPLRAIPPGSRADAFAGATAGIDASDDDARAQLAALSLALGMQPLPASGTRALYHAAAVLAGGAQVALFAEAVRAFQAATGASEPDARAALLPLARGALETLTSREPAQAITGPVPRGDAKTLTAHLQALGAFDGHTAALYKQLASTSLSLSRQSKRATQEQLAPIDAALVNAPAANDATSPQAAAPGSAQPAKTSAKPAARANLKPKPKAKTTGRPQTKSKSAAAKKKSQVARAPKSGKRKPAAKRR